MASELNLRIVVDGDSNKIYSQGDKITGRVILAAEEEQDVSMLMISFSGTAQTKTTRTFYMAGNHADTQRTRRNFDERIRLFSYDQVLLSASKVSPSKNTFAFEFEFPELTKAKFSRWQHGSKYLKNPHPLPPSFHTYTNSPGGQGLVAYFLRAQLRTPSNSEPPLKVYEMLRYLPTLEDSVLESRIIPRVLYAQTWKPLSENRKAIDRAVSKLSRQSPKNPRIVPTIHCPEKTRPGQHIPILLSLVDMRDPCSFNSNSSLCTLDSVIVSIGTHSAIMCGRTATQPEDFVSRHVTCLSKTNLNRSIPFGKKVELTQNFKLIDDMECVPTFKSYTITRRYDLTVFVGIIYQGRSFTIRCTSNLEILPRFPRGELPPLHDDNEPEPLPLYVAQEPSNFMPGYFDINTPSPSNVHVSRSSPSPSRAESWHSSATFDSGTSTLGRDSMIILGECPAYTP